MWVEAAKKGGDVGRRLEEFGSDPTLTLAALGLVVVSLMWLFLAPAIYRNLRKAAENAQIKIDRVRPARDIWKDPPS